MISIFSISNLNAKTNINRPEIIDPCISKWFTFLATQDDETIISTRLGFGTISDAGVELTALINRYSVGQVSQRNANDKVKISLVMEMLEWCLKEAVSVCDFEAVAKKIQILRAVVLVSGNKKKLRLAMEAKLKQFSSEKLPSLPVVRILSDIFILGSLTNTKEGVHLVKRLLAAGREEEAAIFLETQLSLNLLAPGYFNLTIAFKDLILRGELQEKHFKRLKDFSKSDDDALALFCKQLLQAGRLEEAREALNSAKDAKNARILMIKANVLFWQDKYGEAEFAALSALDKLEGISEKEQSALYLNLAQSRIGLGDKQGALEALGLRQKHCPTANTVEATTIFANLQMGNFEEAFTAYWDSPGVKALREISGNLITVSALTAAKMQKRPLPGKCVIICSMGVGDEVRFAQLVPQIKELFDEVTILCDSRVVNVFSRSFPNVIFHGVNRNLPVSNIPPALAQCVDKLSFPLLKEADYVADFKQFAALFRKKVDDIPSKGFHLKLMAEDVSKWRHWITEKTKKPTIGLFWRSNLPSHAARHKQSELSDWLRRLSKLDICIVPLQYDLTEEENLILSQDVRILHTPDFLDLKNDLDEVFSLLKALPLIISLPGTTQHMAGAVGARVLCPCHPYEANWRRVCGRSHELWAPNVEIISGDPEGGLEKSMDLTVDKVERWLDQEGG